MKGQCFMTSDLDEIPVPRFGKNDDACMTKTAKNKNVFTCRICGVYLSDLKKKIFSSVETFCS